MAIYHSGRAFRDGTRADDALAEAVSDALPGWKLVEESVSLVDALRDGVGDPKADEGVDIDTLRKKFLGARTEKAFVPGKSGSVADTVRVRIDRDGGDPAVEVFKVQPKGGGPAQIAERRNGRIRIVSG